MNGREGACKDDRGICFVKIHNSGLFFTSSKNNNIGEEPCRLQHTINTRVLEVRVGTGYGKVTKLNIRNGVQQTFW